MATSLPEEQLLELLVQLQKTTPDQAKAILNSQPQITYALMPLMIKMNLVNLEVLQKVLSQLAASAGATQVPSKTPTPAPAPVPAASAAQVSLAPPTPAIAPHLVQAHAPYHSTPTPPQHPSSVPPQMPLQPQASAHGYGAPYVQQPSAGYPGVPSSAPVGYGVPPSQPPAQYPLQYSQQKQTPQQHAPQRYSAPQPVAAGQSSFADALSSVPEEQREMIMRVMSMTQDQINRLPPQERAITIQLRATLGLKTD